MTNYDIDKVPDEIDGIAVIQDRYMAIDCLSKGQEILRFEFGDSMFPILESGQFCKLVPYKDGDEIKQGDCVFVNINGSVGTHMVWMISENDSKKLYCIATTKGEVIGWTNYIIAKAYGIPHIVNYSHKLKYKPSISNMHIDVSDMLINSSLATPNHERFTTTDDMDFECLNEIAES